MAFERTEHSVRRRRTFAKSVMTVNQAACATDTPRPLFQIRTGGIRAIGRIRGFLEFIRVGGHVTHFELLVRSTSPLLASPFVSLARSHASPYSHPVHKVINENEPESLRAGSEILVQHEIPRQERGSAQMAKAHIRRSQGTIPFLRACGSLPSFEQPYGFTSQ